MGATLQPMMPCCCDSELRDQQMFQRRDEGSIDEWRRVEAQNAAHGGPHVTSPMAGQPMVQANPNTPRVNGFQEVNNGSYQQPMQGGVYQDSMPPPLDSCGPIAPPPEPPSDEEQAPNPMSLSRPAEPEPPPPHGSTGGSDDKLSSPGEPAGKGEAGSVPKSIIDAEAKSAGPPGKFFTLPVSLRKRQGLPLGVDIACYEDCLLVRQVRNEGLVTEWNKSNPRERQVLAGDVIVNVNGVTGNGDLLFQQCANSQELSLLLRRLQEFTCTMERDGKLGVRVGVDAESLVVTEVADDGIIAKYSLNCLAGYQIIPGDLIVSVNGKSGTGNILQETMATAQTLTLVIRRPS